jgi:hypothetical protein
MSHPDHPPDHPHDFSPRRGCVRAPILLIVLAALIAVIVLIAQNRFPFHASPPVPVRATPATEPPKP